MLEEEEVPPVKLSGSIKGSLWERSQTAVVNSGKSSPPKGKNSPVPDGASNEHHLAVRSDH